MMVAVCTDCSELVLDAKPEVATLTEMLLASLT